jgi:heat shock protein HspQ
MLDHFHVEHDIKALAARSQFFRCRGLIVDIDPDWAAWIEATSTFVRDASAPSTSAPIRAMGSAQEIRHRSRCRAI